ncbi:MAG: hypothetical protein N2738_03965, partial [Thermodesulfovibrionales bacterium]|nr:hypothetical protein [Thermodesulfovibrionales bacterium]
IGSKLLYYDDPRVINGIGGRYLKWVGKPIQLAINEIDEGQYYEKIDYIIGASMLVKREFINEVGLMSEDYFLYYEELDLAIRAKKRGWLIQQCNKSIVYHKEGSTIGSNKRLKTKTLTTEYYTQRNKILITRKYYPYCLLSVLFVSILLCLFKTLRYGIKHMKIILTAIYHGLKGKKGFYEGL